MRTKTRQTRPTSIALRVDSIDELRDIALRQSLRSKKNITTSGLVRCIIEDYLDARRQGERKAVVAG